MTASSFHIFKTSAEYPSDVALVQEFLNNHDLIVSWNFDLEDCDNILRILSKDDIAIPVIQHLNSFGLLCEELF